ncbi:hypothetical protein OAA34_00230 [bacterium]|jgi:23S rRNA A2030 N6-methylase RlmJ|nr:hypothetical protein [bacterium]
MSEFYTDKYVRDEETNALISTDHSGLAAYKAKKNQSRKIDEVCDDINSLKQDLADIKEALKVILKK